MATHSSALAWRIPMDRGAWWATVHRVAHNQALMKQLSMQRHTQDVWWVWQSTLQSHSWRPPLTQILQDQLWPQCPVSRQRKDSRERISLLNPKDITHIASAYISLMRIGHMVPHNFKGVWEAWSLVEHLFLSNKSACQRGVWIFDRQLALSVELSFIAHLHTTFLVRKILFPIQLL